MKAVGARPNAAGLEVGRRLAGARLRRGLSQGTAARLAGIAPSYLSRVETGKVQPTMRTVLRVARAVKVSAADLLAVPSESKGCPCPVTASGRCLVDLVRTEAETAGRGTDETYTPRQIRLIRRFASWLRRLEPDRLRAIELLLGGVSETAASATRRPD